MKIGSGGFVTEEKPALRKLGYLGRPQDSWRVTNAGNARAALARKLVREGKTPAEIRKVLAGFDLHKP